MRARIVLLIGMLVFFRAVSSESFAQTTQKPKPVTTFRQKMSISDSELYWSRTYYQSYKKTLEIPYLKLSANHCVKAIEVLKEAQNSLPNTTTYYYKIKQSRFEACQYYDSLLVLSRQLSAEDHLSKVPKICD